MMQDAVANHELQIVFGSDGIVRVNVDDVCHLRVRVKLEDIRLLCLASAPIRTADSDTFRLFKIPSPRS